MIQATLARVADREQQEKRWRRTQRRLWAGALATTATAALVLLGLNVYYENLKPTPIDLQVADTRTWLGIPNFSNVASNLPFLVLGLIGLTRVRRSHASDDAAWLLLFLGIALTALGFFLGMRHATDADHVIAVTTIVTRERTLRGGIVIGILWGVGHTLTILVVGAAIVLFSVVIPPAVGLTMEMTVALMLVALGLWNLAGIAQSVRAQLGHRPGHAHPHQHGDYVHHHRHGHGPEEHGHREDQTPQAWLDRPQPATVGLTR